MQYFLLFPLYHKSACILHLRHIVQLFKIVFLIFIYNYFFVAKSNVSLPEMLYFSVVNSSSKMLYSTSLIIS